MELNKLTLVERLKLERDSKLHGGIYHVTQVEMAYNSNKIEGSRLSEKQTALIFEDKIVVPAENGEATRLDDIKEAENHFKAFDYILNHYNMPLTEDMIKTVQGILKSSTSDEGNPLKPVGEYKIAPNIIGIGFDEIDTVAPKEVPKAMAELLKSYENSKFKDLTEIIDFHVKFERIHPFADGNGRTGRLLMFKEALRNNITPFVLKDVHREFYYRGLSEWDSKKGYLLDTIGLEQDMYKAFLKKMDHEGEVAPIK